MIYTENKREKKKEDKMKKEVRRMEAGKESMVTDRNNKVRN